MKRYLYCRVSTDTHKQEFDRQINIASNYAKNNNFLFDMVFCEKISGGVKATNREEFNKMYNILNNNDIIYVSETSRLGRNYFDCFEIIDLLTIEKKCSIVFISNGITLEGNGKLDPYKWLTLSQMLVFDEFQKRQIGYMTSKGLQAKKEQGVKLGRARKLTDMQTLEFKRMYIDNIPLNVIAKTFNITRHSVMNYAENLGLPKRNKRKGE